MKKVNKFLLTAAVLLAAGATAEAQISFGPRVGLNAANVNLDFQDSDDEFDTKMKLGPQIGVVLNAQFGNLSIQPAVIYSQKGFKVDESETSNGFTSSIKQDIKLGYAEIPVNFVYTTGGDNGFQVFAGPYVGFGLGGKLKSEGKTSGNGVNISFDEEYDVEFASKVGDDEDKEYFRGLDVGANAGIGYKAGPVQVQLGYGFGFGNLIPNDENDKKPEDKANNRVIQLSLTYLFGAE
jgi:hypothetical protein